MSIVDAPGYGSNAIGNQTYRNIFKYINQYARQSSRLCKIYWLMDLQAGVGETDHLFAQAMNGLKLGVEIIFTKADLVPQDETMHRVYGISHELKQYSELLSPLCHITSTK